MTKVKQTLQDGVYRREWVFNSLSGVEGFKACRDGDVGVGPDLICPLRLMERDNSEKIAG